MNFNQVRKCQRLTGKLQTNYYSIRCMQSNVSKVLLQSMNMLVAIFNVIFPWSLKHRSFYNFSGYISLDSLIQKRFIFNGKK